MRGSVSAEEKLVVQAPITTDQQFLPMLKRTPSYLTWLEEKFGSYPFDSAGVVLADSASAMETQQMVTLGNIFPIFGDGRFDRTVLHELARHWFGDAVTPTGWNAFWVSEGWALYAEKL